MANRIPLIVNAGAAQIQELATADNLEISANIVAGGILTDGYYYANGSPYGGGGSSSAAGNVGDIQINVGGNIGADSSLRYVDDGGEMTLYADYFNTSTVFTNDILGSGNAITISAQFGNTVTFDTTGGISAAGNIAAADFITTGSNGNITMTGGNITGANAVNANAIIGNGNLHLQPNPANADAFLDIFLTGNTGPDIHIAGNGENIIIGRDTGANIFVGNDGEVSIQASNGTPYTWTFGADGVLQVPSNAAAAAPGTIAAANGYPTLLAFGSGGGFGIHGGPELDWMNADDPANTFGNSSVLRHTAFLNSTGFYIGMNENHVVGNTSPSWLFTPDGNLTLPAGGYIGAADVKGQGTMITGGLGNLTSVTSYYADAPGIYSSCMTANPDGTLNISTYGNGTGQLGQWNFANAVLTFPDLGLIDDNSGILRIKSPANTGVQLGSSNDQNYVTVDNSAITIQVNSDSLSNTTQQNWVFDTTGNLTTPGNINFVNNTAIQQSSFDPSPGRTIETVTLRANVQDDATLLYLENTGNANLRAWQDINLNTYTQTRNNNWKFDASGDLTVPGNIIGGNANGILISSDGNVTLSSKGAEFVFDAPAGNLYLPKPNGAIVFPDDSIQTTAYSNSAVANYLASGTLSTLIATTGNVTGNIFNLSNAGNLTYSSIQQNQNAPYGSEAYGIELLTTTDDANVFSSVSAGPDYVSLKSTNAGNANVVLQGGYGITLSTSNATGGAIKNWTFTAAGEALYPGNISTSGNVYATNIVAEASFSIQSSDFNAVVGNRYGVDTTSNPVTATLTAFPITGTAVFFADAGGAFATNNLTINPIGRTIMASSGNYVVNTNNKSFGLFWNGTTWRTYSNG